MIKISQKQPSYFEGMEIGDELPIINRDRMKVNFEKSSNESGVLHINIDNKIDRAFEIEYDFDNFPTMRERFIQRIRYLFLRDFSVPEFQNDDLQDTKLNLIQDLDLGYGLRVVKTEMGKIPSIARDIKRLQGETEEGIPNNASDFLPKGTLPDFIYTIYAKNGAKNIPLGFFAIPFSLADEIYDLNTLDEVREFFIDLAESQMHMPISQFAESLKEKHNIQDIAGAFQRLDSGNITSQDILKFYNENIKDLKPGSQESKQLIQKTENLINRLHSGESITQKDLEMNFAKPIEVKNVEHVKDYRRMILLSGIEKKINAMEIEFEQRLKSETDEANISKIKNYYFSLGDSISNIKEKIDETKDIQPLISDINELLEKAKDFIKK